MSGDPEFEDFLRRRRPLFRPLEDDGLEPPAELDRIVLRQAREAIEAERPLRMFGMPRWAAPVAIAATLVVGLTIVFKTSLPTTQRVPEVTVENIAERVDIQAAAAEIPAPTPAPAPEAEAAAGASAGDAFMVDLAPANPQSAASPPAPPRATRNDLAKSAPATTGASANTPSWRHDAKTWQTEIARLRASGDAARADAEQAEFNRQYRAYAVSPDR